LLVLLESQLNPIGGSLPSQLANAAHRKFEGFIPGRADELLIGTLTFSHTGFEVGAGGELRVDASTVAPEAKAATEVARPTQEDRAS